MTTKTLHERLDEETEEWEANTFARFLLMPESLVLTWCDEHPKFTVAAFASAFKVPLAAATIRLHELEIEFDQAE